MMHWLVVLLMIGTYAFIELRVLFPKGEPMRDIFKDIHYWLGLLVLILIFPRIWRVIPPKRAASKSRINTSPAFSAGRVSLLKPSYAFALE